MLAAGRLCSLKYSLNKFVTNCPVECLYNTFDAATKLTKNNELGMLSLSAWLTWTFRNMSTLLPQ